MVQTKNFFGNSPSQPITSSKLKIQIIDQYEIKKRIKCSSAVLNLKKCLINNRWLALSQCKLSLNKAAISKCTLSLIIVCSPATASNCVRFRREINRVLVPFNLCAPEFDKLGWARNEARSELGRGPFFGSRWRPNF